MRALVETPVEAASGAGWHGVLRLRESFRFAEAFSSLRMTKSSAALTMTRLADDFLFHGEGAGAAGRALGAVAKLADVDL